MSEKISFVQKMAVLFSLLAMGVACEKSPPIPARHLKTSELPQRKSGKTLDLNASGEKLDAYIKYPQLSPVRHHELIPSR